MEIKAFLIGFEQSLIENGLTKEASRHHTLKVAKALTDSDKKRIASFNDLVQVEELATNYVIRLRKKNESIKDTVNNDVNSTTATISKNFSKSIAVNDDKTDVKVYTRRDDTSNKTASEAKTMLFTSVKTESTSNTDTSNFKTTQIKAVHNREKKNSDNNFTSTESTKIISKVGNSKQQLSAEGKKEFAKRIAPKAPLIALGFVGAGVGALAVYILIGALILFFILLLVALIAVGGVGTFAGLIYGIIKIFSVLPEGLYEIGFALALAGVTLALSICSYNTAVRAIPILWKKFSDFLSGCLKKYKAYINRIRKECAGA